MDDYTKDVVPRFGTLGEFIYDKSQSVSDYLLFSKLVKRVKNVMDINPELIMEIYKLDVDKFKIKKSVIYQNIYNYLDKCNRYKLQKILEAFSVSDEIGFLKIKYPLKK